MARIVWMSAVSGRFSRASSLLQRKLTPVVDFDFAVALAFDLDPPAPSEG
ncbi:hypothetical protein EMIT0P44_540006 [Pseudomonas sp. IT-P44]|jgi:hypothetical protein